MKKIQFAASVMATVTFAGMMSVTGGAIFVRKAFAAPPGEIIVADRQS